MFKDMEPKEHAQLIAQLWNTYTYWGYAYKAVFCLGYIAGLIFAWNCVARWWNIQLALFALCVVFLWLEFIRRFIHGRQSRLSNQLLQAMASWEARLFVDTLTETTVSSAREHAKQSLED